MFTYSKEKMEKAKETFLNRLETLLPNLLTTPSAEEKKEEENKE